MEIKLGNGADQATKDRAYFWMNGWSRFAREYPEPVLDHVGNIIDEKHLLRFAKVCVRETHAVGRYFGMAITSITFKDPPKKKAKKLYPYKQCKKCLRKRKIGGQAFTKWKCKRCGFEGTSATAIVPALCVKCATEHNRCYYCGEPHK